ncbi:MAG: ATP-binding protein [Pseudonocardia sp.]
MAGVPLSLLVGRDAENAELDSALDGAAAGRFRCVLLVGEAGVGKSRLAAGFAARHAHRCTVLTARAHSLGVTSAFGVWAEALDRELRGRPPSQVRALCGRGDELAALLRSVAALTGVPATEPHRGQLLDALAALVRAMAAQRPLIVVADDLHLADPSSWAALHHLAHDCADSPVLVVGTMRQIEAAERPDALEALLRLEQDGVLRRRKVAPLDADGLRALAAATLGGPPQDALVGWLADRTRGNPLDALDLLGALVEEGADLARPALRRLPESLADRVALRLATVDARAVEVVELLAVIGRRAELRSLVALSGRPPAELADALDRLRRARLVADDDGVVEITHPLVADAVYERIGGTRRRLLHREAGRVLRALGRGAEAAGHYARAAEPGDDEAVTVLREAVHAAEQAGAFAEALTLLDGLVRLLPPGDPRWRDVVDALAWDAQWVLDHRADNHAALGVPALRAMDAALARLDDPAGPTHPGPPPSALPSPAMRAAVKLRLASFLGWGDGTLAEAQQVCQDAIELFARAGDRRGALLAEHELAWLRGAAGDLVVAENGARAVADAAAGDTVVRSRAVRTLGLMAMLRGRPADAEAAFAETAATAGGNRHRELMAAGGLAMAAALAGQVARGRAVLDRIPATDQRLLADYVAWLRWWAGDVDGVRCVTTDVTGIGLRPASRRLPVGLFAAALAALEVGAVEEARRYTATLRTLYAGSGWIMTEAIPDHLDALSGGRAGEAVPQLRAALRAFAAGDLVAHAVPAALDLAEIAWRAGIPDVSAAAELAGIAERTGLPTFRAAALLASAWGAGTDRSAACAAAQRAAAALPEWSLLRARALHLAGRTAGDRVQATALLTEAAALFETCGATLRRAEALDALAALGSRGRRAAAAARGPSSLTAREREVVELAAGGLSAREIGAALFIGERTVEGHLARAYARLGVRSKVELVRRAAELGVRVRTAARTGPPDARQPGS